MKHKEKILKLGKEGKSYKEIVLVTGCSKGTVSYHLGKGQKEKTAQRQSNNRKKIKEYIQQLKSSTPCADCNKSYPYWIMEFDHLPLEEKRFGINKWHESTSDFEEVRNEIKKCEVVCSNCHRDRTYKRQNGKT
jgi:DNA-binding CsgD family transcriptional regulator